MLTKKPFSYFLYAIFCFLFTIESKAQCAMCRAVLETEDGGSKGEAINNGIVYLMIFPYALVAIVFYVVYKMKFNKKGEAN